MRNANSPSQPSSRLSDASVDVLNTPAYRAYLSLGTQQSDDCDPLADFDKRFLGESQSVQTLLDQMLETFGWQAQLDQLQRSTAFAGALVWDRSALEGLLRTAYFVVNFKGSAYVFQR